MAKRKLKDKIEISIFWLGLFCLTYLIFGFILKSDLTKPIDSTIFYEVLRDSLTLTAYFLAPIAALILFSDWREQHASINNEKNSKDIVDIVTKIFPFINTYYLDIENDESFLNFRQKYFSLYFDLKGKKLTINPIDSMSKQFVEDIDKLEAIIFDNWSCFQQQYQFNKFYESVPEGSPSSEILKRSYGDKINEAGAKKSECLTNYLNMQKELKILHV
ncbi:hypothetical protein [Acinetobacter sp. AS23]|uniref:hypothetical protein n=1 Tax=Acinetobacter sp. AS23 TaxID=2871688 RepID=UPI00202767BB|nr:hypothetical protein [Acinetobacter sp. AS23]URM40029.1 hypothetical protein K6I41_13770 [Acinetobacter sp. AS23]